MSTQLGLHLGSPGVKILTATTKTGPGASYAVPNRPGSNEKATAKPFTWEIDTAAMALTINLEGSLDNSAWFTLDQYITAGGGNSLQVVTNNPVNFLRANIAATDGGATDVTIQL